MVLPCQKDPGSEPRDVCQQCVGHEGTFHPDSVGFPLRMFQIKNTYRSIEGKGSVNPLGTKKRTATFS